MAQIEYAGLKFSGSKLLILLPLLSALGGSAWGGFLLYDEFLDLRKTVTQYKPPNLTQIKLDLVQLKEHQNTVENHMTFVSKELDLFSEEMSFQKASLVDQVKYVKEVKIDVRQDMNHLEGIVNDVETKLQNQKKDLASMIDSATDRFDTRRESLYSDTDRKIRELEDRMKTLVTNAVKAVNDRVQKALDNPLSN
tara:strand:+ start:2122 stop:2706 length:585 start_codon:yes stop_codon:yes gene_type:complete